MKGLKLVPLLLLTINTAFAAVGCMDNSYHLRKERFYQNLDSSIKQGLDVLPNENVVPTDYKTWHPVNCSCPCAQYRGYYLRNRTEAEGYCVVCQHRGESTRTSIQNTEDDVHAIERDFALFKNMHELNALAEAETK